MRDDNNLAGPLGSEATSTEDARISSRVIRAVDRVLKETLDCDNATVTAQLCHAISQELLGSSSGSFCEMSTGGDTCTLATCESCVDGAHASGREDTEQAGKGSPHRVLGDACKVVDCRMPCFLLYNELLHSMPSGLAYHRIIRDESGKAVDLEFTEVNPSFERITGIPVGTAAGRNITELLPEIRNDPFDWIGFYDEVVRAAKPVTIEQYSYSLKAWYMVELFPRGPDTLTAIFFDITKQKETEQELRSLNEQLEQRVEEKTHELGRTNAEHESFAYSVSHDLRAPLRSIDGFSRALLEQYFDRLDDNGRHYLDRMRAGAIRMGSLIDDLLKLSRITRRALSPADVNLGQIAKEIMKEIAEREPQRHVNLTVAEDLIAYADAGLIRIALANLLANAWKFTRMRETADIEVSSMSTDKGRVFFVRDNGSGFDMKYSDKLFAPFQRLHSAKEFEGIGIGLATVQRIIHRHGGSVWAESSPEKGATFFFTLKVGGKSDAPK